MRRSLCLTLLFGAIACNGGGGSSPTSPTDNENGGGNPTRTMTEHFFVPFSYADPTPMPDGHPQAFCGVPVPSTGVIKLAVTPDPGGTMTQAYLLSRQDADTLPCRSQDNLCAGAIDPILFDSHIEKNWDIKPGNWCVMFRARSETKQTAFGTLKLYY